MNAPINDDLSESEAVEITGRIRAWVKQFPAEDVQRAFFGRIWIPMGYDSWAEWCDCELDGFRLRAPQRREIVAELAESGMSNRAIADVVGVSGQTVNNDVKSTAKNLAVDPDRTTVGKDGKARPAKRDIPTPEEWEAIAEKVEARDLQERKEKGTLAHTAFYLGVDGDLGSLIQRLRKVLNETKGFDADDFTELERTILTKSIGKVRALLGLVEMRVAGTADVDWDAELTKITEGN